MEQETRSSRDEPGEPATISGASVAMMAGTAAMANEPGRPVASNDEQQGLAAILHLLPPALFLEVVEQSSVAISITDTEACIIYCNQAFARLTGYSRSELQGRNHNLLASQQTPRHRYQAMWGALTMRRAWSGKLINRRKDGSLYLADVSVTPVVDGQGHVSHYLGMHRDISEHHALDQRLQNQMALLAAVLNATPMAVAVLDDNEQILLDNLAYKTLRSDLAGQEPVWQLREAVPHATAFGVYLPLTIRQRQRWFTQVRLPIENLSEEAGHYFGHGRRLFTLVMIQECTADYLRHEQERLEQLRLRLDEQRLLLSIDETLQAASLKVLAPINLLQAAGRLLPESQPLSPAIRAACEEGERAWQWLQACRPALPAEAWQTLSALQLLVDLDGLLRVQWPTGIQLLVERPIVPLELSARPLRLTLALWQLLTFLRERLPVEGGLLHVHCHENDQMLCIRFEDNGPQVDGLQACHSLPFNSLWQAGDGAELTLSLVQEIINDHRGLIAVMGSEHGGLLVHVELPLLLEDRRS